MFIIKIWNDNTQPLSCGRLITLSKIDKNLPISNPKPDLHSINAHIKFGKNPLIFSYCQETKIWTDGWQMGRQIKPKNWRLIVLGFNDTSTLVGHFVSSPRQREKRDRRDSRGDERERQGRKRNRNGREEKEEIKAFSQYPYLLQG